MPAVIGGWLNAHSAARRTAALLVCQGIQRPPPKIRIARISVTAIAT
jgi:hypothetical protein